MTTSLAHWLIALGLMISATDPPAHPCHSMAGDVLQAEYVCDHLRAALVIAGRNPEAPYRWDDCPGCISNLSAHLRHLRCESWLDPNARAEGWVGVNSDGDPVWNRSIGIAQVGDGWGIVEWHGLQFTEEVRTDWRTMLLWLAERPERISATKNRNGEPHYPECGYRKAAQ